MMLEMDIGDGANMTVPAADSCGGHAASMCGEQGIRSATPIGWTVGIGRWRAWDDGGASGRANFREDIKHWSQVMRTESTTPHEILTDWRSVPDERSDDADTPKYRRKHSADHPRGNDGRSRFARREQTCLSFTAGSPSVVRPGLAPPRQDGSPRISCVALGEKNISVYLAVAVYHFCQTGIPLRLDKPKKRRTDEDRLHPNPIQAKLTWSIDPKVSHLESDLDKGNEITPLSEVVEKFLDNSTAKTDNSLDEIPIKEVWTQFTFERDRPNSPRTDCAPDFRIGGYGERVEQRDFRIRNGTRGMDPNNALATTYNGRCGTDLGAVGNYSHIQWIWAIHSLARRRRGALKNLSDSIFESREAVGFPSKRPRVSERNLDGANAVIGAQPRLQTIQKEHRS